MAGIGLKKTLNLHKFSVKVSDIISNWKFILPLIFSLTGLILGSSAAKGQGTVYQKIAEYFPLIINNSENIFVLNNFLRYMMLPTVFIAITFFIGLSAFGGLLVNSIPLIYGYLIGGLSYYLYSTYSLKGLAYCVILIFPYAAVSMLSLILSSRESINMSELLIKCISKSKKFYDYNFSVYYKSYLKNYVLIIASAVLKVVLDYLFLSLFTF